MRKNLWWVLLVFAAVVLLVAWRMLQPAATVDIVVPQRGLIRAYVEEQAVTELPRDYLISMPISGWLEPITLREGDLVQAGEVVARLETDDLRDRAQQARQRIAILESQIAENADHRLEENALTQTLASVQALDETVAASTAKLEASEALVDFTRKEQQRIRALYEKQSAADRELAQAELEFRRAAADLQGDRLNLAALRTIAAVSYIGPKFIRDYIDRKSFTLEQKRGELDEARAQLQIEERNLSRAELRAPVDGVVLERLQTRRQYLAAGTALLTIGRLEELEVIAEVLTERATQLSAGDPVEISGQALPTGPLVGEVSRVYPAGFTKISSLGVEQQRVNVAIRIADRPAALGVGFRVYVRIFYAQQDDALVIPRTALFRGEGGQWQVLVVAGGRTATRDVELGIENDDLAEIRSGLTADDQVIRRPAPELAGGVRVATRREAWRLPVNGHR